MRPLTDREKRTIRIAGIGVGIYLVLFCGFEVWKFLEKKRADYGALVAQAQGLRRRIEPYRDKALVVKKLMEDFHLDPAKLSRQTSVADASAAIQRAAGSGGIQLGAIHESPARPSSRELATIQLEGTGPVAAVTALLGRMDNLGYPLIIDSVQLTPQPMRPGQVKMDLMIVILDFEQWKGEAKPHA